MPLILSGNVASALGTGYDVANSCKFETDTYMTKTASSGNTKTFTVSFWCKRVALGAVASGSNQFPIGTYQDSDNRISIAFTTANTFVVYAGVGGSTALHFETDKEFRDIAAWCHVCIAVDTTQGTEANRVKIYINGTQETSFSTETYPDQNDDLIINTNIYVGVYDTTNNFFHGYLSEVVYIDGTAYAATSFGEFDEDSPTIWKPIDVSGLTFGTNGFYLDFEDSANLGNDANGGTDLTETNLAATDQATDTPTNNFATVNPLYPNNSFARSEGNLKLVAVSNGKGIDKATMGVSSGKWYFECKFTDDDNAAVGISNEVTELNTWSPSSGKNVFYHTYGTKIVDSATAADYGATYGTGDIIGVAYNADDQEITFYKNGSTQGAISSLNHNEIMLPAFADTGTSSDNTLEVNFGGCPAFSISSGNADANGYGNFEYAPPTGFYSLCTKNLAEYG